MISDSHSHYQQEDLQKYKALTPATADCLTLTPSTTEDYLQGQKKLAHYDGEEGTLFTILEQRFERKVEEFQGPRMERDVGKTIVEENLDQCELKIGINILNEKNEQIKQFSKTIIKTLESQDQITLIFDRQHQKLKIDTKTNYIMEIMIETLDGFSKRIWEERFNIEDGLKKWSVMTISSENKEKFFNMEIEKIGKFFAKPLSLKLPLQVIDQFFDYKLKLLNKSQILSTLKSISELKGILLPLTKQNMGSRIIQKLLTKATELQVQSVIGQLKGHFQEMIVDRYGNYVFQKIFKVSTHDQRDYCLKKLQPFMIDLLKSKEGTHCIQTLVDSIETEQAKACFSFFTPAEIFDLSTNKFSMHFIQKLLSIMPASPLALTLISQFAQLAIDRQGIVVMKALIVYSSQYSQLRYQILSTCQQCLNQISFTQFGHYIIEQLFLHYTYYQLQNILHYMITYSTYFAQSQYSSSIVRKALEIYGDYISVPMIEVLLQSEGVAELMECPTGEFVLHRLMEFTGDQGARGRLRAEMMVRSKDVKCYEKRQKWMKLFKL